MKQSKAFIFCLSFCWASFLLDLYAAWQTNYWAMALGTAGVRILMTVIAYAWRASNLLRIDPSLQPPEEPAGFVFGAMPQEPVLVCGITHVPKPFSVSAGSSACTAVRPQRAGNSDSRPLENTDGPMSEDYQPA